MILFRERSFILRDERSRDVLRKGTSRGPRLRPPVASNDHSAQLGGNRPPN